MSTYETIEKYYQEILSEGSLDMWGVVLSYKRYDKLRRECLSFVSVVGFDVSDIQKIFGLVLIPHELCNDENIYIVDESLGREILRTKKEGQD